MTKLTRGRFRFGYVISLSSLKRAIYSLTITVVVVSFFARWDRV